VRRDAAVRADTLATVRGRAEDFAQLSERMRWALDLISGDPSVQRCATPPPAQPT
jgi:hypothetical protein